MRYPLLLLAAAVAAFALTACDKAEGPAEAEPASRPVKTLVIGGGGSDAIREFPARVVAAQRVELAFRIPGKVVKLPVTEGQLLEAGDLIAELDATQIRLTVDDRTASFERAKSDYERAKELVEQGHISRMDFDRLQAQFRSAQAALDQARDDLKETALRAPFAGRVARRFVQNFQEVQAKEPIVSLTGVSDLEVKIDLPQELVMNLRERRAHPERAQVEVSFGEDRSRRYPLTLKEVATQADPKTQTFEATFTLPAPKEVQVLPGMTATVIADLGHIMSGSTVYTVPVGAVVADAGRQPQVWVVDEASMTVVPREVQVGNLVGNDIEVTAGLEPGARIVVAGTAFLREGMKVTLLPATEQPRQ